MPAVNQVSVLALKGHSEVVYAVALSPDSRMVATGSFDQSLKLWDAASGQELRTFGGPSGHQKLVLCLAFSPDGKLLASGGADNQVRLWKTGTDLPPAKPGAGDTPVHNLGHGKEVDALAFHPKEPLLATGGHEGLVRLWDPLKGQQVREIKAHVAPAVAPIYCVAWASNGQLLATAGFDRSLKLWDPSSGKLVRELKGYKEKESEKGHRDGVFTAAFSPDNKWLASGGSDRCLKLWSVSDGTVVREFLHPALKSGEPAAHPGWIYGLRFTPDGQYIISAGSASRGKGYLAVWSANDGRLARGEEVPVGPIYALDLSSDGKLLALACGPQPQQGPEGKGYLIRMAEPSQLLSPWSYP